MKQRNRLVVGAIALGCAAAVYASPWSLNAATVRRTESTVKPAVVSWVASAPSEASSTLQDVAVRYITTSSGSKARYRVRERLLGRELDNDAVGETSAISGSIALDESGAIVPGASSFTVDVTRLKSDETRRDRYVQTRLLETDSFPRTRLAVTGVRGLPSPLPTSGVVNFQLLGDLTVKSTTRPTIWNVSATVSGDQLKGTASTLFTFEQFKINQPKVRILLSVNDTIRLEYDFAMKKQTR